MSNGLNFTHKQLGLIVTLLDNLKENDPDFCAETRNILERKFEHYAEKRMK